MGMVSCGSRGGDSLGARRSRRTATLAGLDTNRKCANNYVKITKNDKKELAFRRFSTIFPPNCYFGPGGAPMVVGFSVMDDFAPSPCRSRVSSKSFPVDFTIENGTSA